MLRVAWLVLILLAAIPVFAQTGGQPAVAISAEDCRALVAHQPGPDVAFQPGVDVRGDPVAPADLPGGLEIEPPTTFIIPIEIDLVERFGLLEQVPGFEADALVGTVLYDDGRLFLDGQPLQDPAQLAIVEACRQLVE
jgi:hypothetical protein